MFTNTNLDKLKQIMAESDEHADAIGSLIAAQKESVGAIIHEIRNPLTLVYSSLQLIESSHPEVYTFRHWDALHHDVLYMMQLLTDLSSYNNSLSLHKKALNTTAFIKQLVLSFAASSEVSDIEFTSYIAPALPSVQADAPKLKEALMNLLKNAFEACPSGAAGSVRLEADTITPTAQNDTYLRIRIQDTGCGIPSERIKDIFTPYVTYKTGGTGLGLPLTKRIVEAHNGTLTVTSEAETGTTFTLLIPVRSGSPDTE
ncbi:MAG: HAMP domain-containing histidine kinase [Dorea sp.]|jgi:signal transduction histidine kinase|nr:HAMP domain-containing histidine kinase [Dorea sp.]